MKKISFAVLLSISFLTIYAASQEEYKREITKEFPTGAESSLHISNKYGNIRVIEGTENKILFKIEIIGKGKNKELAQKYAESVSIDFSQSGDLVSAETGLESIHCDNCGRTIHYVVAAPKNVMMKLDNKYGNIYLENVIKPLTVELKYGDIQANSLSVATIDIKYGKATIQSCEKLNLDSKYSKFTFGKIETLAADSKYDDMQIESVSDFNLETGYANVKIGRLNKSFVASDFKYCSLDISEVATNFSTIKIDAAYTNVKIGLNENHSFKTNLYTKYGSIRTGKLTFSDVSMKKESVIVGRAGNDSNPAASVEISVSYGNIIFK
jgi:hypothetical protein